MSDAEHDDPDELVETVYEVTIYTGEDDGIVTTDEIQRALFRHVSIVQSMAHVEVERR